jgi:hypothetical protein
MTSITNPEVLAVCYAQGWCADANYMTKSEAEAVTNIGKVFKGTGIVTFNEFQYFTRVTSLSTDAFMDCSSLTELLLPDGITYIPNRCFFNDINLLSINLENVTKVDNLCFYNCKKLNNVDTSNMTYIKGAFVGCAALTSADISNCTTLDDSAFGGCTSLTWLDVSNIVSMSVAGGQFGGSKLTGAFVFDSFTGTAIPNAIFDSVSTVTSVSFPNSPYTSIGAKAFEKSGITEFVIREGCTTANNHSFSAGLLKYIDIPSTFTTWNGFVLWSNTHQKVIVCRASIPPFIDKTTPGGARSFDGIPTTCKIYVPSASISAYEAAAGWDRFAGRFLPIEGSWYETHREIDPNDE